MDYNSRRDTMYTFNSLKEIYESNNRLLISLTQITNPRFDNNTIVSLVNNSINTNNQIMSNIMYLLNINSNNIGNRQPSNRQNNLTNQTISNLTNPTISNLFYTFFEPVEIFPTQPQIEIATRVVRFGDIIRPLNTSCPISLENFNDNDQVLIIRHCNHIFSNTGLISWFRTSCKCPICRYDIRNYTSSSSNILPSLPANLERNSIPSSLVELLFSNITDLSGNALSSNSLLPELNPTHEFSINGNSLANNISTTDMSGNSLYYFLTSYE